MTWVARNGRWVKETTLGEVTPKKEFSEKDYWGMAGIFYDTTARLTANIFDSYGQPIYSRFKHLNRDTQEKTVQGLKIRVANEGLEGYLTRKERESSKEAIRPVREALQEAGFL